MRALHPTEIAQVLEDASPDIQQQIVEAVPKEVMSEAIAEMDWEAQPSRILTLLHPKVAAFLLYELNFDDAADLLAELEDEHRQEILSYIPKDDEATLNQLLQYEEDTAGGLMNPDAVKVRSEMTKLEALREVVRQSEEMEDFYVVYVVDEENRLVGYLTFKGLFKARNAELISDIMSKDIVFVYAEDDQEMVAKRMSQYNLPTLPVVDREQRLIGRVTFDDILDVIEEETTEDLLNFVGVAESSTLRGDWINAFRGRISWLLVNLCTASMAALVVSQFEDTIQRMVIIAMFLPIIAGVAGNGASQTLGVTIRRIATNGIPRKKALSVIIKEIGVGLLNGLVIGSLVTLGALAYSYFFNDHSINPQLGLVVFLAMFGNMIMGGLMGSFVPITLERLGIDPAIASSILITAFTDVLGYLLLLGLATLILL